MNPAEAYTELCNRSRELSYLRSAQSLLHWDQRTHCPRKGHTHRVGLNATLARLQHRRKTDPRIGELLSVVQDLDRVRDETSVEAANVREWAHMYGRATQIPRDLAVRISEVTTAAESAWEEAKPRNDWEMFCPHLEQVIMLKREEAAALGFDREPYDAHLDEYERGETTVRLARLFRELTQALRDLISRLRGANDRRVPDLATLHYPRSGQEAFATVAAADLGYDFEAGRLDVSVHPFTSGIGPGDVRITTRYDESDFTDAFFSVIHEAGHGVYHQGLPAEHWGLPVCQSASLGISESQSRLWENMVARSPAYWEHYFPLARTYFPALREVSLEDFVLHVNRVQPGPIRVRADEVTYNLHIIMRFELELALMRGSLAVRDLPQAWNEKTRQYLGLEPRSHSEGVLQDVHWSLGAIGYFPTYTLGNLYAGQIFAKIAEQGGDLGTSFSQGKLRPCLKWLQTNVYVQGRRFLPRELLRRVTGKDLDARYFVKYLQAKYAELYDL